MNTNTDRKSDAGNERMHMDESGNWQRVAAYTTWDILGDSMEAGEVTRGTALRGLFDVLEERGLERVDAESGNVAQYWLDDESWLQVTVPPAGEMILVEQGWLGRLGRAAILTSCTDYVEDLLWAVGRHVRDTTAGERWFVPAEPSVGTRRVRFDGRAVLTERVIWDGDVAKEVFASL